MSLRKAKQILSMQKKKQDEKPRVENYEAEDQLPKKRVNMFSAFNQESSEQQQQEQKVQQKPQQIKEEKPQEAESKKKPKKKKNKNKDKPKNEVDQLEQVLKQEFGEQIQVETTNQQESEQSHSLLEINEGKFKYEKQLSKYFKDVAEEPEVEPQMNKRDKRYMKAMAKLRQKKSVLAPGVKDFVPMVQKLSVNVDKEIVRFQASKKYEVLQEQYDSIKNSNDVQEMFDFMQRNPYHVDAIYNVGEFLRLKGNYKDADELIQRILFIYEQSCSYQVNLLTREFEPKHKFAYERYSSSFFMAIFKFIDILGKKGCYRAALEYNKLLLKMNLDDPTAALLCLDYNAISAKQYDYVLQVAAHFGHELLKKGSTIYWLPNIMYSAALARFLKTTETKDAKIVEQVNIEPELVFTKEHLEKALDLKNLNFQSAQVLILRALLLYPNVFKQLSIKNEYAKQFVSHSILQGSQKLPLKQLVQNPYFVSSPESYSYSFLELQSEADNKGLQKAIETYATRSKILWKANNVMLWVKAACGYLIDCLKDMDYQKFVMKLVEKENNEGVPTLSFQLRRYQKVSKANFSDHVQRIDLQNIQDNQMEQAPRPQGQTLNMGHNPLRLLMQSLLPWMNLPSAEQDPNMPIIEQDRD